MEIDNDVLKFQYLQDLVFFISLIPSIQNCQVNTVDRAWLESANLKRLFLKATTTDAILQFSTTDNFRFKHNFSL